ncbi:MAG TPA: purine-nucleoside phosphorylase [Desulfopila sp.]|nr:purine-nucleoside phosphorylase [Desulfopila sp.]
MTDTSYLSRVNSTVSYLRSRLPYSPDILLQLGTGLGGLAEKLETDAVIPYAEIPDFPTATVSSHHGNLIMARLGGKKLAVLQGRFHYYEGYSTREVAFPVRVLSLLGAHTLIVTNAAGGLNPLFQPGTIMIMRDHLNFLGENPLRGTNIDAWGPRFPDLSQVYDGVLIKKTLDCATVCSIDKVVTGVYVCIPGPSLETPAETRWLRQCGADGVGMSSIPEVLVAIHGGLKVLGLSAIANVNDPDDFQPILLDDIIATAAAIEPRMEKLIFEVIAQI